MKRIISVILALSLILCSSATAFADEGSAADDSKYDAGYNPGFFNHEFARNEWFAKLTDVSLDAWYRPVIITAFGVMNGTSETTFSPDAGMTRAMFVQSLSRLYEDTNTKHYDVSKFDDVKPADWYYGSVNWAADQGIVSGTGDRIFNPNGYITREEAAVMLYNFNVNGDYKPMDYVSPDRLKTFKDAGEVSGWAEKAMIWAVSQGKGDRAVMNGTPENTLEPQKTMTRAEAAQMFYNYIML